MAAARGQRTAGLRFRLLGPVDASRDGEQIGLGGPRQRALLTLLLLHANEVVPRERLIDGLWGEEPPGTAANALQVAVHGLRKALGGERIETYGAGYRLHAQHGAIDLDDFRELIERARLQEGAAAAATLGEGLALWRGEAHAGLGTAPFASAEAARLEELRLAAVEARIDAPAQARDLAREHGDETALAWICLDESRLGRARGDGRAAVAHALEGAERFAAFGTTAGVAECLDLIALVAETAGRAVSAVRLFGAADALREPIGSAPAPTDEAEVEAALERARGTLGDAAADAAWSAGRSVTADDVVELARTEAVAVGATAGASAG